MVSTFPSFDWIRKTKVPLPSISNACNSLDTLTFVQLQILDVVLFSGECMGAEGVDTNREGV